jgi:hypothetical protein
MGSFGLAFLGARFADAKLIGLAYAFEQRTLAREKVKPYVAPRSELWAGSTRITTTEAARMHEDL